MTYLLKLLLYCFCLTTLPLRGLRAEASFEDADQVNEFITMSFSSSHPYDLRQTIPGEPEIDYPIYSAVPRTNFDCNGRHEGYYADVEARCQVFRICANTDFVGKGFAFLCPNGTLFSQKNFVCDWYRNVDCGESERFYSKNDNNRIGSKSDMMKTVRQMMEHPMKTISIALNRGKATTPKPVLYTNAVQSSTKAPRNVQTIPTPASRLPSRSNVYLDKKSDTPNTERDVAPFQIDIRSDGPTKLLSPPLEDGIKPLNDASVTVAPPSPTFSPPFESPKSVAPYDGPSPSNDASFETFSSGPQSESQQLSPNDGNVNDKEVYISSLGELSTDPGANFNPQTSRIISDPPSNALDTEIKLLNASSLNFAEKVNAGLNGLEIENQNGIIAPDYVKNLMQQNTGQNDEAIQPVPFDLASNINSLLDEATYETELGVPHSEHYHHESSETQGIGTPTKKSFRFLSRGFSHESPAYEIRSASTSRNVFRTTQPSTSTQSLSNSLITTLLTTTETSVTPSESSQIVASELATELSTSPENSSLSSETVDSQIADLPELALESQIHSKQAVKREQKELRNFDSIEAPTLEVTNEETNPKPTATEEHSEKPSSSKDSISDVIAEDKADANKKAEDLLLAGVKQITVTDRSEKSKITENEDDVPVIPIYTRNQESQNSTPHISSSSTTPTTLSSPTPNSSTISTVLYSVTTDYPTTSTTITPTPSLPTSTLPAEDTSSTTPAVSIKRFTVGSGNRRQTSRPITYSRRNNLPRNGKRTTTATTKSTTTTAAPTYRGRSGSRKISTTPAPISSTTTRISTTPRKRLSSNRYTYGSRRRTTESTASSTSSTTTSTVAPPSRKLSVRSSDSAYPDLTAVASTYNAAPNRAYNSIRQGSYKSTQTKRPRPSHRNRISFTSNNTSTTTTAKPSTKISTTTQQPRSTSSLPTPTLGPFSYHEATLSSMPISSTTPESLPATYLSFNDLTKSITDDSILQTLRKNQDFNRQLVDSAAFRNQQQVSPRQQLPFSTASRPQQVFSTKRPPIPVATTLPFLPLKDFIASKFGAQYSPEPPKLSTIRPTLKTPIQQYSKQQYGSLQQEFVPQQQPKQVVNHKISVQPTMVTPFQQQSQLSVQQQQQQQQQQRQQQQQYLEQQIRLQQQLQKFQQLKQEQNLLQQQYQIQQQQKLQQQLVQQQQKQSQKQQYFQQNQQQQVYPSQQYQPNQLQQQQRVPTQQQVSTKIVPSVEQQFQIQQSVPLTTPPLRQQQNQKSQIQIIPSQMTMSQTIHGQQFNSNAKSEIGSINVRLPSNFVGLIPSTNIFDSTRNSFEFAQRRSDLALDDVFGARERKSVFVGVSSYDVPLSSVGRLANDVTFLLRQRRH